MERGKDEKNYSLVKFKHKHSFFVLNLCEIVSIKIEDFFAGQGEKPAHEQIFIWGSYNLIVKYLKYNKGEIITAEKLLAKGFSRVFTPSPDYFPEEAAKTRRNLICEAEYNYRTAPVSLFLFPLLSKLKFIPYKVTIIVQGKITAVPINDVTAEPLKNKSCVENKTIEVAIKEAAESMEKEIFPGAGRTALTGEDPVLEEFLPPKVERLEESSGLKKEQNQKQADLVAREKQKISAGIPVPNPQYYKTYRFFYDHFYLNQQVKETKNKKNQ